MPGETSCYNVFFQEMRLSGQWIGEDILFKYCNTSVGQKSFLLGLHGQFHDWGNLPNVASKLKFSGTEPIKFHAKPRDTTADDLPGGDAVEFSIRRQNPVLIEIWSSRGSNELTQGTLVQYLNMQVHGLPDDAGGLLGLDEYARPAQAKCGFTQEEQGKINNLVKAVSDMALISLQGKRKVVWRMSAQTKN